MSTGTTAGLLEDSDSHAQSVFKHEILRQYMSPFIAMAGSTATSNRLTVLDGFAGRGRYPGGEPGSAEHILQAVQRLQDSRKVSAYFVEKSRKDFEILASVVEEYASSGMQAHALHGSLEDHLETVIASATGMPLLLFLDPCGAGLPFQRLAEIVNGSRRGKKPPTEILLNFNSDLSRRATGSLRKGLLQDPIIRHMDLTCGGEWWRETALTALNTSATGNFEPVAHAVADEYTRRLADAGGMLSVNVPVRRRLSRQPIYHLAFFTHSSHGLWMFANAIGKARQKWLQHWGKLEAGDTPEETLFGPPQNMDWLIDEEAEKARERVRQNLLRLVRSGTTFKLVTRAREVYGDVYGVAIESTVTKAVRTLEASGELVVRERSKKVRDCVVGPPKT
ncbi:three-Cys-motif partner protein TcmP [Nocardiopsis dassonvillei]|uniref:three-Cys-motif partner protein TcmP n=1 Tax=Nocardiopsis dassonvillei TaxID=2014 RepID=UPI0036714E58